MPTTPASTRRMPSMTISRGGRGPRSWTPTLRSIDTTIASGSRSTVAIWGTSSSSTTASLPAACSRSTSRFVREPTVWKSRSDIESAEGSIAAEAEQRHCRRKQHGRCDNERNAVAAGSIHGACVEQGTYAAAQREHRKEAAADGRVAPRAEVARDEIPDKVVLCATRECDQHGSGQSRGEAVGPRQHPVARGSEYQNRRTDTRRPEPVDQKAADEAPRHERPADGRAGRDTRIPSEIQAEHDPFDMRKDAGERQRARKECNREQPEAPVPQGLRQGEAGGVR